MCVALNHFPNHAGFSSADNGALHLAVLDILGVKQRHKCFVTYQQLVEGVQNLCPHFNYVACTRKLLGPTGTFHAYAPLGDGSSSSSSSSSSPTNTSKSRGSSSSSSSSSSNTQILGTITIFPRLFGFVVDPAGLRTGGRNLHPFHHGVKNVTIALQDYGPLGPIDGSQRCVNFSQAMTKQGTAAVLKTRDREVVEKLQGCDSQVPRWYTTSEPFEKQPKLDLAKAKATPLDPCFDELWCPPKLRTLGLKNEGVVTINGTLQVFKYSDPGRDWFNIFATEDF